jgi:hypothetical protein
VPFLKVSFGPVTIYILQRLENLSALGVGVCIIVWWDTGIII